MDIRLPIKRKRGGQGEKAKKRYKESLWAFAENMKEIQKGLDFHMSARGWCYAMEPYGLNKDDFDYGQNLINECREFGLLEPGFILEEESRRVKGQEDEEQSVEEYTDIQYEIWQESEDYYKDSWQSYSGISFWEDKDCYIQLLVEKVDLKSLFTEICNRYKIPLANLHGWGTIEQRAVIAKSFREAEARGKKPILFACTDFDPPGLEISNKLKKHFEKFSIFTGWRPYNLEVERIGIGYNFIQENHLTWTDNLISSNGIDMSNPKSDVYKKNTYHIREYIAKYGIRKCEANAIVVVPELGRKILQDAINKWLGKDAYKDYGEALEVERERAKELIDERLEEE